MPPIGNPYPEGNTGRATVGRRTPISMPSDLVAALPRDGPSRRAVSADRRLASAAAVVAVPTRRGRWWVRPG
ncbi:MAG: hypothetical protein K0U78_20935 [Actinomycetia bacterium]|nr:hypothetical protein [Actinomycetes bacterium]